MDQCPPRELTINGITVQAKSASLHERKNIYTAIIEMRMTP